ncbi:MAG: hypothetical protein ABJC98_09360 [Bacteroidota bacterium]
MRQVNPFFTFFCVAAFLIAVASCSKDGSAGATGPAGPAGPAGGAGAAGPKGDTGVANVIYSAWLDAVYLPDTVHNGALIDTIAFYLDATGITKLTAAILNTGEMKVYINRNTLATPIIWSLPYWDPYTNLSVVPTFLLNEIYLYADADFSTRGTGAAKIFQWRYILIPGGKNARSAIDWNNYAEVKKYLNLKD